VAAHAASLRTLRLSFDITLQPEFHQELAALEGGFLESVLLAAPLPALQRLDLRAEFLRADEALWMEVLRPLARLCLPRLTRLSLSARAATGQGVRLLEGAHLPALRHLEVLDLHVSRPDHPCITALVAPNWSALEALELRLYTPGGGTAALSAALAPTLRRLAVYETWPFGREGCAEWPQLRSLEVGSSGTLAARLRPDVRLPRLERLAASSSSLRGFGARRAALPALRVVRLELCFCGDYGCPVDGCAHPRTVERLTELRAAWPGLERRRRRPDDWTQA
jgi:hypothetical protein